ncbi:MAG: hypothetical protein IKS37_03005 [Solobacterium sp.]|nr:hypothetical protein [Solobacterium sp.]
MNYASICKVCGKIQYRPWGAKACDECGNELSVSRVDQSSFMRMTEEQQKALFDSETWMKHEDYELTAPQRHMEALRRERDRVEKQLDDALGTGTAKYQYAVEILEDGHDGRVKKSEMTNIISVYAARGWELDHIYASEVGRESSSYGGMGTNSTICQHILIFRKETSGTPRNVLPDELRF